MPDTLPNGEWLEVGESLWSENGEFEFRMQDDGKIAVYQGGDPDNGDDGRCIWQNTAEQRYDIKGIRMQEDGNFCMYTHDGEEPEHCAWHSDTAGDVGDDTVYCIMQNDGNVVLYKDNDEPIWATNTGR
ncbi:bulb-type lectin domain-containing protein [Aspergillus caelatus]|uniref:Bulb-type lectin domain-containing protein n=2 Tax=Aspergillus subgen. Circumdati TaxID=2720871 RepID=A0A5N7AKY9_9EURO|nr:bulb-type lectin domain-containing protein [Aspergillus caelatus]KAE8370485.1 bulb-type lectin domain-containing protein [Aspergillus caelatus]KAE8415642.1 bulb-type lectin domain-containing protein [Aspergillus pseudocaelatus]